MVRSETYCSTATDNVVEKKQPRRYSLENHDLEELEGSKMQQLKISLFVMPSNEYKEEKKKISKPEGPRLSLSF